jgi:hypothetical protein
MLFLKYQEAAALTAADWNKVPGEIFFYLTAVPGIQGKFRLIFHLKRVTCFTCQAK